MSIAFFDLDRTLISTNSASGWIKREIRDGHLSWKAAIQGGIWISMYQLGFARMDATLRRAIATLNGLPEADIRRRTQVFWKEEVCQTIRPGARDAIARHRQAGDRIVLLTSSSIYLAEAAAAEMEFDGILCNRFEVVGGMFTGRPIEPLCFGSGKVIHARQWATEQDVDLMDCCFYTDSYSDLPMMEAVGKPVSVHPDPRLRHESRQRTWPIVDWS